ncbi:hypothetical protein [Kozakia baliensis]|uniref:Uncharacterized protein n=1 Tax=Kozakia baliensis TaxID=153496 RepID=A0A1D8UTW1_9PROT|nr:hypothetical protein [Kozakia baliensis]AOX16907.1 hypothetical protein A0U89_06910 [Kozakia baliensis]GBR25641.1 hypothetical protein AA0488_0703 [Kozakia baliensis NRIC 0488]GEL64046.1 hypothetical protein KBA01_13320 [Kozakia baliensis]
MNGLVSQIKQFVVLPTLAQLGTQYGALAAINLVTAVGNLETGYRAIRQTTNSGYGVARGFWQMESFTHDDCWTNFLAFNPKLAASIREIAGTDAPTADLMEGNAYYGCAMARIKLLRAKPSLPVWNDARGITGYWKDNYNSALGAGSVTADRIALSQQAINA